MSDSKHKSLVNKFELAKWKCEGCGASAYYYGKRGVTKRLLKLCQTCRKWVLVYDQRLGLSQFQAKEEMKTA